MRCAASQKALEDRAAYDIAKTQQQRRPVLILDELRLAARTSMKAGSSPGAEKPMVKLRLSIEPASEAGSERRGTLVVQVGVLCLGPLYPCCAASALGLPGQLRASVAAPWPFQVSFCCWRDCFCVVASSWLQLEAYLRGYMIAGAT